MEKAKKFLLKILFSTPIAFFLGVGLFTVVDIIQPSFFKRIDFYWPYILGAYLAGILATYSCTNLLSSLSIQNQKNNKSVWGINTISFLVIFLICEALFSVSAVKIIFGSDIELFRLISTLFIPLTFSLFYFPQVILEESKQIEPKKFQSEELDALLLKRDELLEKKRRIIDEALS